MNQQSSKTIGVVLLLAAALLTALFAQGVFAPPGAGAQRQPPPNTVAEVDGGRAIDERLTFRVYPPATGWSGRLDSGDQIAITFPADPEGLRGFTLESSIASAAIELSGSGDEATETPLPLEFALSGNTLTLTIPDTVDGRVTGDEHLVITIDGDNGIEAPEIPRGFEDPNHPQDTGKGYPVEIAFIDSTATGPGAPAPDNNFIVVKNPLSSTVPSAAVRVDLVTYAEANIGPSEEIVVDFSGPSDDAEFVVPARISTNRVTISYTDAGPSNPFSPSDVRVQGAKVTLTIPTGTSTAPAGKRIPMGEYTITFRESAGIKNPFAAGNRVIKVSSSVGDLDDEITAVIRRSTEISPEEGPRGSEFTLDGRGYPKGTVTIYHDGDDDGLIDAGETIESVETVRGAFIVTLTARGVPGEPQYKVKTKDSRGVDDEVVFNIIAGIIFQPVPARVGAPLRIAISDWADGFEPEVAAVSIAGQEAYVAQVIEYRKCFDYTGAFRPDGYKTVSLEIEVPPYVPPGKQAVSVYGPDQLQLTYEDEDNGSPDAGKPSCLNFVGTRGTRISGEIVAKIKQEPNPIVTETIQVVEQGLTLTPAAAARGQEVIITGSGFTRAARGGHHIANVWIGGERVVDDHSGLEVDSAGDFAFTVTVPLDIPDGKHEVLLEGNDNTLGRGTLTIPEATISLDREQSQQDTELKVTGSGFIADEVVILTYGPENSPYGYEIVLADSQGNFELTFTVPFTAEVGKSHKVRAVAETDGTGTVVTVDAEARHLVPRATITVAPASVSPGDRLTIRAHNLPAFSRLGSIRIEGIDVFNNSGIVTDENGSFEAEVLVPNLEFGDQTLLVSTLR